MREVLQGARHGWGIAPHRNYLGLHDIIRLLVAPSAPLEPQLVESDIVDSKSSTVLFETDGIIAVG